MRPLRFLRWRSRRKAKKVFVKEVNGCFGNKDFATYLEGTKEKELMNNEFVWPNRFVDVVDMEEAVALLEGKSIEE